MFALVTMTYLVKTVSVEELKTTNQLRTNTALKKAKQALINYAVLYPEITGSVRGPGYMPCPDINNDGKTGVVGPPAECNSASGINNVGRLPYITLGIDDVRDAANERLWYAVTKEFDYSDSPSTNSINGATVGTLTVRDETGAVINDGTTKNGIVAVIIAPGATLTREDGVVQSRGINSGDDTSLTTHRTNQSINYLDIDDGVEDNATFEYGTLDGFINGDGNIVNDQIETITYAEIMNAIHTRFDTVIAEEVGATLNAYYLACLEYPAAAPFNPDSATLVSSSPAGVKLENGLVPMDTALPFDWGAACGLNVAPTWPVSWVTAEGWHRFIYYEFCDVTVPPECITLNAANDTEALLVFAGRDVGETRVTGVAPTVLSDNLSDYFENENNTVNNIYSNAEAEDFIYVLRP